MWVTGREGKSTGKRKGVDGEREGRGGWEGEVTRGRTEGAGRRRRDWRRKRNQEAKGREGEETEERPSERAGRGRRERELRERAGRRRKEREATKGREWEEGRAGEAKRWAGEGPGKKGEGSERRGRGRREGERGMPARREEMRGKRQGGNGRREVEKAKRGKWKSKGWAGGRDILLIYIPSSLWKYLPTLQSRPAAAASSAAGPVVHRRYWSRLSVKLAEKNKKENKRKPAEQVHRYCLLFAYKPYLEYRIAAAEETELNKILLFRPVQFRRLGETRPHWRAQWHRLRKLQVPLLWHGCDGVQKFGGLEVSRSFCYCLANSWWFSHAWLSGCGPGERYCPSLQVHYLSASGFWTDCRRFVPPRTYGLHVITLLELIIYGSRSSGAVWESRWTSWAVRPNEPSGQFRGRKDLLNRASALVTTCP